MAKKSGSKKADNGATRSTAITAPRNDQMTRAQLIMWACLHLLVILVPIATSNLTWLPGVDLPFTFDQFDIVKVFLQRALVLVGLGAWAWHVLVEGGRVRRTKIDWLILVVLAWFVVTTFTSISPEIAIFGKYRRFEGLLSFFTYAGMFFLGTQMLDRGSRIRSLSRSLFFAGVFVSVYGLMQYVGLDPVRWGNLPFEPNRSFSTYGNPDLLGGYVIFPLAVSLALALSEEDTRWRLGYWLGFGLTVLVWITAFTRGSWIGGGVALLLLGVLAFRQGAKFKGADWSVAGVFGALAAAIVVRSFNSPTAVMNVPKRILSIFNFEDASAKTRFEIWQAAIDAIKDRPIQGFGLDTFRLVFPKYKPIEYVKDAGYISVADNVHNYPLQLASAVGIPGFLLLYGLFITAFALSAPVIWAKQAKPDRLILGSFWAASVGYLVALSFGISVTGSSFLLWISLAVILSPLAFVRDVPRPSWGTAAASLVLVLVLVLLIGNVIYITADNHYLKSRITTRGDARIEQAKQAVRLNPWNDMYRAEVGLAYVDVVVSYYTQAASAQGPQQQAYITQALQYFRGAEEALLGAIEFVPWEYDNYVFTTNLYTLGAEIYRVAGDNASAEEMLERAVAMGERGVEVEPFGPAVRFQLARALLQLGRAEEAREHMAFGVEMDPNYVDGQVLLGDIERELGNTEAALAAYKQAQAVLKRKGSSTRVGVDQTIAELEARLNSTATTVVGETGQGASEGEE